MVSMVARVAAAAAAALPSWRARCSGSVRLPLAALPEHGAVVVLAGGRRVGAAGHGGVLAVEFKSPGRKNVKAVCADTPSMGDEDEDKAVQEKLKEIAEKCIALNFDAMRRLPRAERRRLEKVFWLSHFAFATVRSRATNGRANMEMAMTVADKLFVVLKMVSNGCSTPLPLDEKKALLFSAPVFPLDHGVKATQVLVFKMIDNLYNAVKSDIDAIISGASRA